MGEAIRIKVNNRDGVAEVRALMPHPMESGLRLDPDTGQVVPEHYIREVICKHNGNVVMTAYWGTAVSRNPYVAFQVMDVSAGDRLEISWVDNKGDTSAAEAVIG